MPRPAMKKIIPFIGSPNAETGPAVIAIVEVALARNRWRRCWRGQHYGLPTMGTARRSDAIADAAVQAGGSGEGRAAGVEIEMVA
jgi:hypothetical protein